ncbi:hypothetical protein SAMN05421688_3211 [Poseidonocella pacifica]|uniref:Uncharacterized protein n=1 Tax=Poseidonocella pacifica TaxID=871651 RepID=A0A1I0YNT0_9RHOB|nr:hypothetical protein SAMN05421688_3211 [Poseidonocella pacifica]
MSQILEYGFIEQLVPHTPVETFHKAMLHWLARLMPEGLSSRRSSEEPTVAEPPAFVGQLARAAAQFRIRGTLRLLADHLAIRVNIPAG